MNELETQYMAFLQLSKRRHRWQTTSRMLIAWQLVSSREPMVGSNLMLTLSSRCSFQQAS
jgi:hypothetical protein